MKIKFHICENAWFCLVKQSISISLERGLGQRFWLCVCVLVVSYLKILSGLNKGLGFSLL